VQGCGDVEDDLTLGPLLWRRTGTAFGLGLLFFQSVVTAKY